MVAIAIVLAGYRHVLLNTRQAPRYAAVCAALGAGTFLIHAGFALAGLAQFHLPLSIAIIVLCLACGVWLLCDLRRVKVTRPVPA
nr:DUF6713 family protein [Janthinobacterium sp. LM6]